MSIISSSFLTDCGIPHGSVLSFIYLLIYIYFYYTALLILFTSVQMVLLCILPPILVVGRPSLTTLEEFRMHRRTAPNPFGGQTHICPIFLEKVRREATDSGRTQ